MILKAALSFRQTHVVSFSVPGARGLVTLKRAPSLLSHDLTDASSAALPAQRQMADLTTSGPTSNSRGSNTTESSRVKTVVVTGAAGNLGHKVANHLLTNKSTTRYRLVLMDSAPCPPELYVKNNPNGHDIEYVQCDFSRYDSSWVSKFDSCDAAMLFAAKNPTPDATSLDAYISMMINAHTLEACAKGRAKRVIFASSNHVMGAMLHEKGKKIPPDVAPRFGTRYKLKDFVMDSTLYAAAKVAGEVEIQSMVSSGRLSEAIVLRIGFCQPGHNEKKTLPLTGHPTKTMNDESGKQVTKSMPNIDEKTADEWWKGMYLKNEDLESLLDRCLDANVPQHTVLYVNGVSRNPESRWITDNHIGYSPSSA